jgi:hypothetical protein
MKVTSQAGIPVTLDVLQLLFQIQLSRLTTSTKDNTHSLLYPPHATRRVAPQLTTPERWIHSHCNHGARPLPLCPLSPTKEHEAAHRPGCHPVRKPCILVLWHGWWLGGHHQCCAWLLYRYLNLPPTALHIILSGCCLACLQCQLVKRLKVSDENVCGTPPPGLVSHNGTTGRQAGW